MTEDKFGQLWDTLVVNEINIFEKKHKSVAFDDEKGAGVWGEYERLSLNMHERLKDADGLTDRHKIGSLLLSAFYTIQPFHSVHRHGTGTTDYILKEPNIVFGIRLAVTLMHSMIMTVAENNQDKNRLRIFKKGFYYSDTPNETPEKHFFKSVYHPLASNEFSIYQFAYQLHQMEQYTIIKYSLINKK